jgi:hypothetical protein
MHQATAVDRYSRQPRSDGDRHRGGAGALPSIMQKAADEYVRGLPGVLGPGATGERKGPGQRYGMCKNVRERQPGPYALTKRIIAANPKGRACSDGKTVMNEPGPLRYRDEAHHSIREKGAGLKTV